jgi:hypothetical protein
MFPPTQKQGGCPPPCLLLRMEAGAASVSLGKILEAALMVETKGVRNAKELAYFVDFDFGALLRCEYFGKSN